MERIIDDDDKTFNPTCIKIQLKAQKSTNFSSFVLLIS